jgi:hypothetical protein
MKWAMPAARAPGNERLAQCLDGLRLAGLEQAEGHVLRSGFARGQEYLDAADREREGAGRRALHEVTSLDWVHRFLSMLHLRGISLTVTVIRAPGFGFGSMDVPSLPVWWRLSLSFYTRAPSSLRGVIPEIDIWRVANLMLKRYGNRARQESARHADELWAAGDTTG